MNRLSPPSLASVCLLALIPPAVAVDVKVERSLTAGSPSGLWSDIANWTPNQVPDNLPAAPATTYHASIAAGAPLTLIDGIYTVNRLDVTGASLQGQNASSQITVVADLTLDSVQLRGPGALYSQGTAGIVNVFSNSNLTEGFNLRNGGTMTFESAGFVLGDNQSRFDNLVGATFTMAKAGLGTGPGLGVGRVVNAGTFILTNTSQFAMGVDNLETTTTGVVNVFGPGNTAFGAPATTQAGDFTIDAGAGATFTNNGFGTTVTFTDTSSLVGGTGSGINLGGLGKFAIAGDTDTQGIVYVTSPEVDWTRTPARFHTLNVGAAGVAKFSAGVPDFTILGLSNGTLTGTGDHTIAQRLEIAGVGGASATLSGAGTTTLASGGTTAVSGSLPGLNINQRRLTLQVGATYSHIPTNVENGGEFHNLGTVTDAVFTRGTVGDGTLRNDGEFRVTNALGSPFQTTTLRGDGTTSLDPNTVLDIARDADSGQDFNVAAGATLTFGNTNPFFTAGTRSFSANASVTGAGNVNFARGTDTFAGTFAPTGNVLASAGTHTITTRVMWLKQLDVSSQFSFPASDANLRFTGGLDEVDTLNLAGTATFHVTDDLRIRTSYTWNGGTHSGPGTTWALGTGDIAFGTLSGRNFVINGSTTLRSFYLENNAGLSIGNGATLDARNPGLFGGVYGQGANPGAFTNAGFLDCAHDPLPGDRVAIEVGVRYVQESTGRLDFADDFKLGSFANIGGSINFLSADAQLLLRPTANAMTQGFTEVTFKGTGTIDVDGDPNNTTGRLADLILRDVFWEYFDELDEEVTVHAEDAGLDFDRLSIGCADNGLMYGATIELRGDAAVAINDDDPVEVGLRGNWGTFGIRNVGNEISYQGSSSTPLEITVKDRVTYFSPTFTGFHAENIAFTVGKDATIEQTGEVRTTLAKAQWRIEAAWTLTNSARFTLEDEESSVSASGMLRIPLGYDLSVLDRFGAPTDFRVNGPLSLSGELTADLIAGTEGNPFIAIGWIMLANTPGTATITGSLRLGGNAVIEAELAGTQQGVTYDHLDLNGPLSLEGGRLDLRFLDGFESSVQASTVFVLVEADAPVTGAFANVASGARLNTSDDLRSFEIFYGPGSPHGANRVVATNVAAAVAGAYPPVITVQPVAQSVAAGGPTTLAVTATGTGPLTYQWYRNGVAIPGATGATYTLPSTQAFHAGDYGVIVSNTYGPVLSTLVSLNVTVPPANTARLLNLSTRAQALTGSDILIPGFVVSGTANKRLLIRAVGPTLGGAPYNVPGTLNNPRLALKRLDFSTTPPNYVDIAANDDWGTNANAAAITQAITDLFAFPFADNREAALLVDLAPGQYTVFADGVADATGIAIVELYDADAAAVNARLINISNRGFVGTGAQVMIPGFVVSSEGPKTLLIRVVGPTLAPPPYNVPGTMTDPRLQLFRKEINGTDTLLLEQDNWGDNPDAAFTASTAQAVSAFALARDSADAAFVVTLPPGVYTVVGSAADGTSTGVVLVEVYVVP